MSFWSCFWFGYAAAMAIAYATSGPHVGWEPTVFAVSLATFCGFGGKEWRAHNTNVNIKWEKQS